MMSDLPGRRRRRARRLRVLTMAEAAKSGHWKSSASSNEKAGRQPTPGDREWVTPIQQRHFDAALQGSLKLAADEDPNAPAVSRTGRGRSGAGRKLDARGQLTRFSRSQRPLVPGHPVGHAGAFKAAAVGEVPVVGLDQRLRVRKPRAPAEQPLRLRDVDERVPVSRLVVPLGERREPRELERAQRELGRPRRDRASRGCATPRGRSAPRGPRARCRTRARRRSRSRPRPARVGGAHDRVDEVLDGEQLVAVAAVAEHVDAPALADPVEQDLEHAEPLGADERLRAARPRPRGRGGRTRRVTCSASIFDSP